MTNWISIKDQGPPEGTTILITDGKVIVVSFWKYKLDGIVNGYRGRMPATPHDLPYGELVFSVPFVGYTWEGYGFGGSEWEWSFRDWQITHWMPLPKLPGEEVIINDRKRKGRIET